MAGPFFRTLIAWANTPNIFLAISFHEGGTLQLGSLLPNSFALRFCPVVDEVLLIGREPRTGMQYQILPDAHLSAPRYRSDLAQQVDLTLRAILLPSGQIQVFASFVNVVFH